MSSLPPSPFHASAETRLGQHPQTSFFTDFYLSILPNNFRNVTGKTLARLEKTER